MNHRLIILVVGCLLLSQCKKTSSSADYTTEASVDVPDGFVNTGIDQETLQKLMTEADHIDYMFNDMPLSMNQDGQQAVLQDLSLISTQPIDGIKEGCKPLARKIYFSNGEIIMEGDIYFTQECVFQVFILDEKPLYGNLLTSSGIAFYNNLLQQADQTMPDNVRAQQNLNQGN